MLPSCCPSFSYYRVCEGRDTTRGDCRRGARRRICGAGGQRRYPTPGVVPLRAGLSGGRCDLRVGVLVGSPHRDGSGCQVAHGSADLWCRRSAEVPNTRSGSAASGPLRGEMRSPSWGTRWLSPTHGVVPLRAGLSGGRCDLLVGVLVGVLLSSRCRLAPLCHRGRCDGVSRTAGGCSLRRCTAPGPGWPCSSNPHHPAKPDHVIVQLSKS